MRWPIGELHGMGPNTHLAYNALWLAHPLLQSMVVATMLWRKLHRSFPFFFSYVAFQILVFAVTFPFRDARFYRIYFTAYWIAAAISVILGFLVIREVFLDVFRPYHTLRDLGSVLFKWAGLVMLMVAGVMAASARSGAADEPIVNAIMTLERSVRVVQCGLVLFLLVFSRYLGVNRQQKSFGIALGFGAFASVELSLVALQSHVDSPTLNNFVNMAAYNLAILTWFGYMFVKSPAVNLSASMLRPQRWEQSLNDLQHPGTADSLIPMFESMVDRALSRTSEPPALQDASPAYEEKRPHDASVNYSPLRAGSRS